MPFSLKAFRSRSISEGMEIGSPQALMALATSFRPLPGDDGDDSVVLAQDTLVAQLLQASCAGDTSGLTEDAAVHADHLLGSHDLFVGDIDDDTVGLPDGSQSLICIAGHADGDRVSEGGSLPSGTIPRCWQWRG